MLYAAFAFAGLGVVWLAVLSIVFVLLQARFYGGCSAQYGELVRRALMPMIAHRLGQSYRRRPRAFVLDTYARLRPRMLAPLDERHLLDDFAGCWRGCDYRMVSLYGEVPPLKATWSQLLLQFTTTLPSDETLVIRQRSALNSLNDRLSREVRAIVPAGLDPRFTARFSVFGAGRERSAELLQPSTQEVLLALDRLHRGRVTASITDGNFAVALDLSRRRFWFGGPLRSRRYLRKAYRRALFEAALPQRIIDLFDGVVPKKLI